MKQHLLDDICLTLGDLRIPYTLTDGARLVVHSEFYDVGYGVEAKIVLFDMSVFFDEDNKAVFMSVQAGEKSYAGGGQDAAVRPSTIFRQVRHVVCDDSGDASVTAVNLGDVPNAVKNAAFKYGWKFRTAFNLNRPPRETAAPAPMPPADQPIESPAECLPPPTPPEKPGKTGLRAALRRAASGLFRRGYRRSL